MSFSSLLIYFSLFLSLVMAAGYLVRSFRFRSVLLALLVSELGFFSFFIHMLNTRLIYNYPYIFILQFPVVVSLGPVLYFYVLSLTEDKKKIDARDWLHYIPTLLMILLCIPLVIFTSSETQRGFISIMLQDGGFILLRGIIMSGVAVFVPVIYMAISIKRIWVRLGRANTAYRAMMMLFGMIMGWFLMGMVGIVGTIALSTPALEAVNYFLSVIIVLFYIISQKYPYLMQFATIPVKKKSYTKSHLDRVDLTSLRKQLLLIMEEEKLYCDEDLSLARLSDILSITQHQLSQFLNTYYQQNFNNFINSYRVNEAKKILLEEPRRQTLSVALAVGFNSYSAFHAAFKKNTGMSPIQFRQQQEIEGN